MILERRHREFFTWVRDERGLETIRQHGDRVTHVGLFFFQVDATGRITGELPASTAEVAAAWPHITWLLTIRNDGIESIWRALLIDRVAQDRFISEIHRILNRYWWASGVDIDLERGPNDLKDEIYALYARISREVRGRGAQRHVHLDLPPMDGPGQTIGPEQWCEYERLRDLADTVVVMTYGYAWSGSSPGATSPVAWVRRVMEYAARAFDAERQLFMGVPQYGYRWQLYGYPGQPGVFPTGPYRGVGAGFESFLWWMAGKLSHTDQYRSGRETQRYVPFASFYDERDFVHRLHLHIYDYPGAGEEDARETPPVHLENWDRPFLTCYQKTQRASFGTIAVDLAGTDYTEASGAFTADPETGMIAPRRPVIDEERDVFEEDCIVTYAFDVPSGTWDVVVNVEFPFWDRQRLAFELDGIPLTVGNVPQWYPYHRQRHWWKLGTVTGGSHTLTLLGAGSQYGTRLYRVRVCSAFSEEFYGGEVRFTLRPRPFLDVQRRRAWPHGGRFILTLELLRRDPDYAPMWYDDFRAWSPAAPPPEPYYRVVDGDWQVTGDLERWLEGQGIVELAYDGFEGVVVRADLELVGTAPAGVSFGEVWLALNPATGRVELYRGTTLLAAQSREVVTGARYRLALRVRRDTVNAFLDRERVLEVSLGSAPSGAPGVRSQGAVAVHLFEVRDSTWRMPMEAVDVVLPGGSEVTLGRIPRDGVTWDPRWEYFAIPDGEEEETRQPPADGMPVTISLDWDYVHTPSFQLAGPGDYPVIIRYRDAGVWLSRLYLGDADGFSIAIFPDAETVLRLSDIAAYDYRCRGVAMWAVGLEDPQLWAQLVRHV